MRPRNTAQNKRLYGLINFLGIDEEQKKVLVYNFTDKRTSASSGMNYYECQDLIDHLQTLAKGKKFTTPHNPSDKAQKMRRKILSICHEMGWEVEGGKIDWESLNRWLVKYGYKKYQNLNDYSEKELPTLVTQFENLLKSHYEKKPR